MQPDEFDYIAAMLRRESGMHIKPDKTYLLESRLQPVARSHGYESISDLIKAMRMGANKALQHEVTQVMTTNETMFFRDGKPFDHLRRIVMPAIKTKEPAKKHIRIWSAACSSGQEPYTIAMSLLEDPALKEFTFEIMATDICEKTIKTAKDGIYSQFEVQRGMPIQLLLKYFTQLEGNRWQVKDDLKKYIKFNTHNLLDDAGYMGRFDIVFCRNVLIYFDLEVKQTVMGRLADVMNPSAFLLLGVAETVLGVTDRFRPYEMEQSLFVRSS